MAKSKATNMVWIDLEMSGLDSASSHIIEIATIITDSNLNIVAEGPVYAIQTPEIVLSRMDDWNTNQHTRSGLLYRVRQSQISLADAENGTLEFIKQYCPPNKAPLCGNSIHHDRTFLIKFMPTIIDYLHYRIVDVSSFKEMILRWYGEDFVGYKKKELHLALEDIRESIAELRFYRENYFRVSKHG